MNDPRNERMKERGIKERTNEGTKNEREFSILLLNEPERVSEEVSE